MIWFLNCLEENKGGFLIESNQHKNALSKKFYYDLESTKKF
jgi:hypothetical protein